MVVHYVKEIYKYLTQRVSSTYDVDYDYDDDDYDDNYYITPPPPPPVPGEIPRSGGKRRSRCPIRRPLADLGTTTKL